MKQALVKAAIFTPISGNRWGLPAMFWGEPGVAKTSVIEEVCKRYDLPCETLSPSERGEGAFGVVPVPVEQEDGKTLLVYPAPEWTEKFMKHGRGVVFVDEATSTPPALQAPLMGLILARRIGGVTLPAGVRMLSAANPTDIAAGGFDLAAPVANRVGHIDWTKPSVEEHVQFMLRGAGTQVNEDEVIDAEDEEARVMKLWGAAYAGAVGLETAFLTKRPELKNQCPKAGDPKASRAWPSDRTWEMATRALASAKCHNLSETETEIFVAAFVGEGPAGELFTWAKDQDLPDPAALLDGKTTFKHNPKRPDRTVAVMSSCAALVMPKGATNRPARAGAMWELIGDLMETSKADLDIVAPVAKALISAELHTIKESGKIFTKLVPILRIANIVPGSM